MFGNNLYYDNFNETTWQSLILDLNSIVLLRSSSLDKLVIVGSIFLILLTSGWISFKSFCDLSPTNTLSTLLIKFIVLFYNKKSLLKRLFKLFYCLVFILVPKIIFVGRIIWPDFFNRFILVSFIFN